LSDASDSAALQAQSLLDDLARLAVEASAAVARFAGDTVAARSKADLSPVTAADEASEAVLLAGLARVLPGVPVISEEQADSSPQLDAHAAFVLVDPLDGTREFLSGRDEYTVNIAVVADGVPVVGIVAAPALRRLWRGAVQTGADRMDFDQAGALSGPVTIATRPWRAEAPVALVSRSHLDDETAAWVAAIPNVRHEACGSALKFCRLAEGAADVYARLAPTCEWDMAAGDAVLIASGGVVTDPYGTPLIYGNQTAQFRVPTAIAWGDPVAARRLLGVTARRH
jgi:3'(2'), 5'-bisphosphate nucleotidase